MKTRLLMITLLIAVIVPVTSFAQNTGDGTDKLWLSACPVGTGTECNQFQLFHNAISAPFSQSDSVGIGTIIQKENTGENSISYSIDVDFYLKNYQSFDLLIVTLDDAPELQKFPDVLYYNSPVFNEGDLVFVYLVKNDGSYDLLPESFALDKQESRGPPPDIHLTKSPSEGTFLQGEKILVSGDVRKMELVKAAKNGERLDVELTLHRPYDESDVFFSDLIDIDANGHYNYHLDTSNISPGEYHLKVRYGPSSSSTDIAIDFNSKYWSPLKQFKSGVPDDEIQCRESLILVKKNDGSPACVKELTLLKLVERGLIITSKAERDIMLDAGYKLYHGAGWIQGGQENESSPEPERTYDVEMQLRDAKKSLKNAYQNQLNLGPYYMKDVVIGFGTHNDILVVDIASKYTDTDSFQTVKKEIQHIVGNGVKIDYVVYDEPIERHIETVIPYMWNKILHQKNIDFAPKEMSYFNNADGFKQHDRVCSPLVASNGTEFYISSTFDLEPFEITGTFIDKTEPDDCHKVWETDVLMTEPDRITALWLENED